MIMVETDDRLQAVPLAQASERSTHACTAARSATRSLPVSPEAFTYASMASIFSRSCCVAGRRYTISPLISGMSMRAGSSRGRSCSPCRRSCHDLWIRRTAGGPGVAPHLGGGARKEHAVILRLPVARLRAVGRLAPCPVGQPPQVFCAHGVLLVSLLSLVVGVGVRAALHAVVAQRAPPRFLRRVALGKYQDLNVLDTLDDEFDPVRAMDAFGMHVITSNPGMEKAPSRYSLYNASSAFVS